MPANESLDMSPLARILGLLVILYRTLISPWLPPSCRFYPSCSEYALQALKEHGAIIGMMYIIRRLARCQPWGGEGFDPVVKKCNPSLESD